MNRLARHGLSGLTLIAASAIGLGLTMLLSASSPFVEVRNRVCEMGKVTSRTLYPVTFQLHNAGSQPVHILGANSYCGKKGCISRFENQPATVGPGEDYEVKALFRTPAVGRFSYPFVVYTDAPGQASIRLTIEGESVAGSPGGAKLSSRGHAGQHRG